MTIDEILSQPDCDLSDPVGLCATGSFRWGSLQARLYNPCEPDWQQPFLYSIYERTRLSGQRHPQPLDLVKRTGLGPLPALFCGMTNLGIDSVTKYLAERAVCVVGEWHKEPVVEYATDSEGNVGALMAEKETFVPLGYCFPSTTPTTSPLSLTGQPSNSVFAGYTIFSEIWRRPQQTILMYLGLAWLFHTFQLVALHGSRYSTNHLTARWTHQFGFRDCGELPYCMTGPDGPAGELVGGVFSTLLRADFEIRLREVFAKVRSQSNPSPA